MGRRYRNLHDKLRYRTDKLLLELVQHGRRVFDGNGQPVMDDNGEQMRQPATAADISNAIKRLKDVGHTDTDTEGQSPLGPIVRRMKNENSSRKGESDVAARIGNEG